MIKTIKHIISLFAITSVLAFSFMGCTQTTTPEKETTPEIKDTVALAEVTNLKAVTGDKKVTLSWTNPTDADFSNVIISYGKIYTQTEADETNSIDITGLENGKAYTFKVQTVDKKQNISTGVTVSQYPMNPLTETPTWIEKRDIIINDQSIPYDIVEFGDWPQSKIFNENIICDKNTTIKKNGWDCYYGSDGAYYVKLKATPYYEEDSGNVPETPNTKCKFDDGTNVEQGKEYYFKLEPIQWRVLTDDYNGKKLLFAEKALAANYFYKNRTNRGPVEEPIYPNNYEKSDIRTYLNEDFKNKAFTQAAIAKIADTVIDNSDESTFGTGDTDTVTGNQYACADTNDKIFLLSAKEITNSLYGFDTYDKIGAGSTRIRKTTDYARATYAITKENNINSLYWLRSPLYADSCAVRYVFNNGDTTISNYVDKKHMGVVPALTITSYVKQ